MGIYTGPSGRRMTLTEAMATSKLYIALVTHNFIEDVRNGDTRIIKEIETAKSFNLHCILFLFDNLTEDDKKFTEKLFRVTGSSRDTRMFPTRVRNSMNGPQEYYLK